MDGLSANQFQNYHMNDIPVAGDRLTINILLYNLGIVDGNFIEEIARRSLQRYGKNARLLRCNNHISYVSNIDAVFKFFHCPDYNAFLKKTINFVRYIPTCSE